MSEKKITIMTLGDHPLLPSGVGTQTKYVCEALLRTGKFRFVSLGGAVHHPSLEMQKVSEWGDDWVIQPVNGYGERPQLRGLIQQIRPDIIWFMTDPRFYEWLWKMEKEIRPYAPLVYYHVWDNVPMPHYNAPWYESTDVICSISKVTHNIVTTVSPDVESYYVPHAVNPQYFNNMNSTPEGKAEIARVKRENGIEEDRFIFFWNNRNARRKQSGSLVYWYSKLLERVGYDKTVLLMHTDPRDAHGQPLDTLQEAFNIPPECMKIHNQKVPPQHLNYLYNMSDCTINVADAEGFGLATLESLATGTPIIVNMTGGLQEQVTDGEKWFGIGIQPSSKAIIGSQSTPYIFEDRVSEKDVVDAMEKMLNLPTEEYKEMSQGGLEHIKNNYNFKTFEEDWVRIMTGIYEKYGSWETRKNYTNWETLTL